MNWASLAWEAPGIIRRFIMAFRQPNKIRREAKIAEAVVDLWMLIDPLLPSKTSESRIRDLVDKYVPMIAAEFES